MSIMKDMDGMSKNLEKVLTQLTQIDKSMDSISLKSGRTAKALSGMGTGNSIMPNPASFGGGSSSGGGGGEDSTSNGMPIPKFGGSKAAGALAFGMGALKFGYNATPGLQDTYAHQNALFQSAFFAGNGTNMNATYGRIKAAFGNTGGSTMDRVAASAMFTANGINTNSRFYDQSAGEAGFMANFAQMSLPATAKGMLSLQSGAGVSGRLAQYGIFTNNLSNGNFGGMGAVIDQLWARWYGSKSAKVPKAKFDADLLGGFLGQDLRVLFGDQPELYNMIVKGLQLKAQAGGQAGIDFGINAKGPNSANSVAKKMGMNEFTNPGIAQSKLASSQEDVIQAASAPMMKAFSDATGLIIKFNEAMQAFIDSPAGQAAMYGKGFGQTLASTSEGAAGLGALGGLLGGIGSSLLGRGLGSLLGRGGGAAGGGLTSGLLNGLRAAAPRMALGLPTSGLALLGRGALGLGTYYGLDKGEEWLNTNLGADQDSGWFRKGAATISRILFDSGKMGAAGAVTAGAWGGVAGSVGGLVQGIWNAATGQGWDYGTKGSIGVGRGDGPGDASGAVSWATNTAGVDGKKWRGLCDRFVANAYGLAHSGYESARAHWEAIPARYKHPGDTNPPAGALVFWNCGQYGHVAISTGSGAVQTTHLNNGTPTTVSLSDATRQLGGAGIYFGWAEPYFGGRVLSPTGGASSDGTTSPSASGPSLAAAGATQLSANDMANPLQARMGSSQLSVFGTSYSSPMGALGNNSGSTLGKSAPTMSSGTNAQIPTLDGSVSKTSFAQGVLRGIGAPVNDVTQAAMLQWMAAEGGHWNNSAHYNPLNSTLGMPGSGHMAKNPNIKAYVDWQQGLEATVRTLTDSNSAYGYAKIIDAFRSGSSAGDIYSAIGSSRWGTPRSHLPSHAHGSDYVARSGMANVHQGEMIIPASQAMDFREALRDALSGRGSGNIVNINLHIEKASDEEAERFAHKVTQILKNEQRTNRLRTR